MARILITMILSSIFFFSGCGYGLYFVHGPETQEEVQVVTENEDSVKDESSQYYYATYLVDPIMLEHVDLAKKKAYIKNVKETLVNFYKVARDTHRRQNDNFIKELGREVNNYVKIYIEPVINDPEAVENLETRPEIAKLHLLSASLYFDLSGYYQAKFYLERLSERYESEFLSSITIDQMNIGYSTVAEGVKGLKEKISLKHMARIENK